MSESIDNLIKHGDLSGITTYQAGIMQSSVHRLLQKHCDEILKPYGISKMQWLIIGTVLDAGDMGIRLTDLAKITGTTLAYLTTAVNTLELKDMLRRVNNQDDNRSKIIRVDPLFAPRCAEIEHMMRDKLRKSIYAEVSLGDFRTYMKVLYQLSNVGKKTT